MTKKAHNAHKIKKGNDMSATLKVKDTVKLNEGGSFFTHTITAIESLGGVDFYYLNGNENSVSKKFIIDRIIL